MRCQNMASCASGRLSVRCPAGVFRVRAAIFDRTLWGVLSPPHTTRALGSATQGHARGRDSRAVLGEIQYKEPIRQTYSGRSARDATRPQSQPPRPTHTIVQSGGSQFPAMIRLTDGYARCKASCSRRVRRPMSGRKCCTQLSVNH